MGSMKPTHTSAWQSLSSMAALLSGFWQTLGLRQHSLEEHFSSFRRSGEGKDFAVPSRKVSKTSGADARLSRGKYAQGVSPSIFRINCGPIPRVAGKM